MSGTVILALAAVAVVGGYLFDLWRRPMRSCRRCKGTGRVRGSTRKAWGWCPSCHEKDGRAKPPRPRMGARLVRRGLKEK